MKLRDFVRHLQDNGCVLVREGGKYSIWQNPAKQKETPVTRHLEIADFTARKICKALDIPLP
jgi:predicted RNA binding protein YcfA (HicA-like mRNA interferase family)